MSGILLAALLQASGVDLELDARASKGEDGYALQVSGRARSLPEGAIIRLRFRRLVNRVRAGVILTGAAGASWVRRVAVWEGAFVHREVFDAPLEVEVEAAFDPAEQERRGAACGWDPAAVAGFFPVGSPVDAATALQREAREIAEALAETARYGGEKGRARAARRLAALREGEPRALFSATVSLLAETIGGLLVPPARESGGHGPGVPAAEIQEGGLSEAVEGVRRIFERERAILVATEAGRLRGEGSAGLRDRALAALRRTAAGDDELQSFLRAVEGHLRTAGPGHEGEEGFRSLVGEVEAKGRMGY